MLGLGQVEQIRRFEHGAKVKERATAGKPNAEIRGTELQTPKTPPIPVPLSPTQCRGLPSLRVGSLKFGFRWSLPCLIRKRSLHRRTFSPFIEGGYGPDTHCLRNLERRALHAPLRAAQPRNLHPSDSTPLPET